MKKLIYFIALFLPFQVISQSSINGTISDTSHNLLDGATVSLSLNGKDLVTRMATRGKFSITDLQPGEYRFTVTLVGYKSRSGSVSVPLADTLRVELETEYTSLKEVSVSFRKPTISRQPDKLVFNVDNSILASGGNAWDALGRAPGVQLGNDGSVKAANKSVVVYLDGKPVRISGDDLASYLKSIPSDNIQKMEVMTSPSSKYEAQGGAVINIITKRSKADGFNTSLTGGYTRGELNRFNGNAVFNYRRNKLNVFGNYGYADRDTRRHFDQLTHFNDPSAYAVWDMQRGTTINTRGSNYSFGADYNLSQNQVIGVLINGNNTRNSGNNAGNTYVYNDHRPQYDSVLNTISRSAGTTGQYSYNLNYKVKLDSNGRALNIDIDYSPYAKKNLQQLENFTYDANKTASGNQYRFNSPSRQSIDIWSGKIDYNYTWLNKLSMESGLKYTSIISNNQFDFFDLTSGSAVIDPLRSDKFRYMENTAAAYTSTAFDYHKWDFKLGLRAEYTRTEGYSASLDSTNTNGYLRLFPTVVVAFKPADQHEFGFTYSKRIERPDYRQLNPARSYSTPYNYWSGNPFLRPSIINDLRVNYTWKKNYTLTAVYTKIDDLSSNVIVQDNINKTWYDTQQNLGRINDIGLEFSSQHQVGGWWQISNTAQGYHRAQRSDVPGNTYNYRQIYFYLRSDHQFTIDKNTGLKAELSAWFNGPQQQGTLMIKRTYDLSAGFSVPVLNKLGTVRFSVADVFNGNPYRIVVSNPPQNNIMYQQNDTRTLTVSFSYKFGKAIAAARRRSTASEEERRRVN